LGDFKKGWETLSLLLQKNFWILKDSLNLSFDITIESLNLFERKIEGKPDNFNLTVSKTCFGNRGFRTFGIYRKLRSCSILNFPKITKKWHEIKFWKSWKARSDSKTKSNVCFKVQNAGPYLNIILPYYLIFIFREIIIKIFHQKIIWLITQLLKNMLKHLIICYSSSFEKHLTQLWY